MLTPPLSHGGFGAEVRAALGRGAAHLVAEGLATRSGRGVIFARDLLAKLRIRELDATAANLQERQGCRSVNPPKARP